MKNRMKYCIANFKMNLGTESSLTEYFDALKENQFPKNEMIDVMIEGIYQNLDFNSTNDFKDYLKKILNIMLRHKPGYNNIFESICIISKNIVITVGRSINMKGFLIFIFRAINKNGTNKELTI